MFRFRDVRLPTPEGLTHGWLETKGATIAAVGAGPPPAASNAATIDGRGLTLLPGFIDVHSHAAEGLGGPLRTAEPLLAQGITTVVVNPDGGGPTDLERQRTTFEAAGVGVNVAQFVPHGSIRAAVLGMADRPPTDDELARMRIHGVSTDFVRRAISQSGERPSAEELIRRRIHGG